MSMGTLTAKAQPEGASDVDGAGHHLGVLATDPVREVAGCDCPDDGPEEQGGDHPLLGGGAGVQVVLDEQQRPRDDAGVVAEQQAADGGDRRHPQEQAAVPLTQLVDEAADPHPRVCVRALAGVARAHHGLLTVVRPSDGAPRTERENATAESGWSQREWGHARWVTNW
jgi:hypothetical protein